MTNWKNVNYGSLEKLKELLLNKRIVEWNEDFLLLEDGTRVTIEMSESDCCAFAGGKFKDVKLDAIITDIKMVNKKQWDAKTGHQKVIIRLLFTTIKIQ